MHTKTVQLIGKPKDRALVDVTAHEIRADQPIFVPYVPENEKVANDIAMAEYGRFIYTTERGQLMLWVNPHLPMEALREVVRSILNGERSLEGVWILRGADIHGNLQMTPLRKTQ